MSVQRARRIYELLSVTQREILSLMLLMGERPRTALRIARMWRT